MLAAWQAGAALPAVGAIGGVCQRHDRLAGNPAAARRAAPAALATPSPPRKGGDRHRADGRADDREGPARTSIASPRDRPGHPAPRRDHTALTGHAHCGMTRIQHLVRSALARTWTIGSQPTRAPRSPARSARRPDCTFPPSGSSHPQRELDTPLWQRKVPPVPAALSPIDFQGCTHGESAVRNLPQLQP
jgi:hypothetical protein